MRHEDSESHLHRWLCALGEVSINIEGVTARFGSRERESRGRETKTRRGGASRKNEGRARASRSCVASTRPTGRARTEYKLQYKSWSSRGMAENQGGVEYKTSTIEQRRARCNGSLVCGTGDRCTHESLVPGGVCTRIPYRKSLGHDWVGRQ